MNKQSNWSSTAGSWLVRTLLVLALGAVTGATVAPVTAEARGPSKAAYKGNSSGKAARVAAQREQTQLKIREFGLLSSLLSIHPLLNGAETKPEIAAVLKTIEESSLLPDEKAVQQMETLQLKDSIGHKTWTYPLPGLSELERSSLAFRLRNHLQMPFRFLVVNADVKAFADAFRQGAQTPEETLRAELLAANSPELTAFIDSWLRTPIEKRVFVTASRQDDPYVDAVREQAQAGDMQAFSYRRCFELLQRLCSEAAVGAFFGSSGHFVHIDSPGTRSSEYIPVEVALIDQIGRYGPVVFVFDTVKVRNGTGGLFAALVIGCTIVPGWTQKGTCLQLQPPRVSRRRFP